MMDSNNSVYWQRHVAIERALLSYYDLEMRYPSVAQMVVSRKINERTNTYEFREGDDFKSMIDGIFGEPLADEAEAENEAWRNMMRAIASIISQIFHASRDAVISGRNTTPELRSLQEHGDAAIATIVGRSWRSLDAVKFHFWDNDLKDQVARLVDSNAVIDAEIDSISSEAEEAGELHA